MSAESVPGRSDKSLDTVFFDRRELEVILRLYGRKVASGEWRDYGIESSAEYVSFNIHRRTSEAPLYRVEKRPSLSRKQGAFAVYNAAGMILKRGHELPQVLSVLDKTKLDIV